MGGEDKIKSRSRAKRSTGGMGEEGPRLELVWVLDGLGLEGFDKWVGKV